MLWLIGMMGSGKSTVGLLLSQFLALPFVDLDARIEETAGFAIPELFATEGEDGFRTRESAALVAVAEGPPSVVATGGGVVLDPRNVALMRETGVIVWLEAEVSTLAVRVRGQTGRPLLGNDQPGDRLSELLGARNAAYARAAHARIATDERTPEEIAEEVGRLWLAS